MAQPIRFDSAIDLASYTDDGVVSNTETDLIVVKPLDVDSTTVAEIGGNTQATLYIDFTIGSLTNVTIRIYQSYLGNPSSSDWYQETIESDSGGTATLNPLGIVFTASAKVTWHFPIGAARATRITAQSSGTTTNSKIHVRLGLRSN